MIATPSWVFKTVAHNPHKNFPSDEFFRIATSQK